MSNSFNSKAKNYGQKIYIYFQRKIMLSVIVKRASLFNLIMALPGLSHGLCNALITETQKTRRKRWRHQGRRWWRHWRRISTSFAEPNVRTLRSSPRSITREQIVRLQKKLSLFECDHANMKDNINHLNWSHYPKDANELLGSWNLLRMITVCGW